MLLDQRLGYYLVKIRQHAMQENSQQQKSDQIKI